MGVYFNIMSAAPKIVFLDASSVSDLAAFDRFSTVGDFTSYPRSAPEEVVDRCKGAQVIVTNKVELTAAIINALPDLRLICIAATGTNNVDKAAAAQRNIPVRNVAGYSTDSVAQLTLTAVFTIGMDLIYLNNEVYNGNYGQAKDFTLWRHPFYELSSMRLGIIGLGTIGRRVAELATAYGAEIVYHSISGSDHDVPYGRLPLDELLSTSDVVTLHCALSEQTRDLIGAVQLRQMKSTALLINTARGGIVNERALVDALNAGTIARAAVDVFSSEPLPADHPYLEIEDRGKLLLTPHVGWASVESRTRLIDGIVANIREDYPER